MSNLTYTKSEIGLEVVILNDGSAYCTQSSYARFSGKTQQAISARAKELETIEIEDLSKGTNLFVPLIKTKIETNGGLQEVVLIPAKVFGRWLAKDNPDLFDSVVEAGATQFLYKVAGYEIKAIEPEPQHQLPQNYLEALKALVISEEEKQRLAIENQELMTEVNQLAEICDELFGYSSILRVAKFNEIPETGFNWRTLKSATQELGLEIKKAPCPRYVTKNLYPHEAWLKAYPNVKLPETTYLTIKK